MGMKLVLETTAPFQGLPELVAHNEGLFAAEGLEIEFIKRGENAPTKVDPSITSHSSANAFASHGSSAEQGKAAMFNACEWGNYCRVEQSSTGGRQLGRRAIVTYGAIAVAPGSDIYTPQQLANKTVGVPYYAGTHYLAMLMLEGFVPRDAIKTCLAPNGAKLRLAALLNNEVGRYDHHRALHHGGRKKGLPHRAGGAVPRYRGSKPKRGRRDLRRVQPGRA